MKKKREQGAERVRSFAEIMFNVVMRRAVGDGLAVEESPGVYKLTDKAKPFVPLMMMHELGRSGQRKRKSRKTSKNR